MSQLAPAAPAAGARRGLAPLNPRVPGWAGRRVWIVGASSGIGAALARLLLERGATVALSARREQALRDVAGDTPAEILPLDVTDAAAVARACATLRERWPRVDLVLWVAGTHAPMRAQDFDVEAARRLLETNVGAVLGGLASILPWLIEQRSGGIALVSSVAGYGGLPTALAYGPTKAALNNLAEALYLDLRPQGIGVTLVCPGFVDTPLTATNRFRMPGLIDARQAAEATLAGIAAGRFEVHYPRRFTLLLKLARLLPYRLYFAAVHRLTGL